MCLDNSVHEVRKLLASKYKLFTFYKVLAKRDNGLYAPCRENLEYKPGVVESDSRASKPRMHNDVINHGIHVYTTLSSAKMARRALQNIYGYHNHVIVKVTAHINDLIGVDKYNEAVFKKVRLSKAEYARARNRNK